MNSWRHSQQDRRWRMLRIILNAYGRAGRVDMQRTFYGKLTLGGFGWIDSNSVVIRRDAEAIEQFIALTGHANDGLDGQPLLPTMELPF
jgi:hypothetical protein